MEKTVLHTAHTLRMQAEQWRRKGKSEEIAEKEQEIEVAKRSKALTGVTLRAQAAEARLEQTKERNTRLQDEHEAFLASDSVTEARNLQYLDRLHRGSLAVEKQTYDLAETRKLAAQTEEYLKQAKARLAKMTADADECAAEYRRLCAEAKTAAEAERADTLTRYGKPAVAGAAYGEGD